MRKGVFQEFFETLSRLVFTCAYTYVRVREL